MFENKIFAVHLHDNDMSDDLHLLPFEGTIDWKELSTNLKKANYQCLARRMLKVFVLDNMCLSTKSRRNPSH